MLQIRQLVELGLASPFASSLWNCTAAKYGQKVNTVQAAPSTLPFPRTIRNQTLEEKIL
jgi:hypothetical protein